LRSKSGEGPPSPQPSPNGRGGKPPLPLLLNLIASHSSGQLSVAPLMEMPIAARITAATI
jgi:hypothetical protein